MRTIRTALSYIWTALLAVLEDIRKALNLEKSVFPFIQQQFSYLLWIFVVPAALYLMAQGRELLVGFFDDNTFVAGFRAAALLLVYLLTSLTVLMSPWPFFPKKTPTDWERINPFTWQKPGATYVLSVLPGILFYSLMLSVMWREIPPQGRALELLTLAIVVLLARWFWLRWPKWRVGFWQTWAALLLNMALCWLMITRVIPSWKASEFWNYHWIGLLLGIQVALIAGLARVLRQDLVEQRSRYKWMYLLYFTLVAGYVVALAFMPNLEAVSPIYILLLLSAFYLLLSSLLVAFFRFNIRNGRGPVGWKTAAFFGVLIGGPVAMWVFRPSIHTVNTVTATMPLEKRADFDEWFEAWWETQRLADSLPPTGEIPIYLVAVQGGGSRAGLWSSEILNRLEIMSRGRFHRHCLAVTAASGGSAGTGATLALWRFAQDSAAMLSRWQWEDNDPTRLYNDFNGAMFQRNYLSGQFYDIFVKDALAIGREGHDRNFRHQRDEALGFAAGLRKAMFGLPIREENDKHYALRNFDLGPRFRSLRYKGDADRLSVEKGWTVANYPFMPYLSYWYDGQGRPRPGLPLYFPITCNLHNGRSGYASPLRMGADPDIFTNAIDILDVVEKMDTTDRRTLALATATNMSELFPLLNAFTRIEKSGNYMDGGMFENMGLTVLMEMYRRTDSLIRHAACIPDSLRSRVRIHVVCIENNALDMNGKPVEEADLPNKAQIFSLLKFPGRDGINGRTTYYLNKLRQTVRTPHLLHEVVFQDPLDKRKVPLGRWLSIRSVDAVENRAVAKDYDICCIVEPIRGDTCPDEWIAKSLRLR
jgi:hypothetical protein